MPRPARPDARDAVLDAARDEFARRGVDGARVQDIALRAGISKGAYYLHFRTKEAAFREIVSRFLGALEDHTLRRYELEDLAARNGAEKPLAERVEEEVALDVEFLELLWRNRLILAAVEHATGRLYRELVAAFRRKMRELVTRRMARGIAAGVRIRSDVPPEIIADIVVGTYEDFARRMIDMKAKPDLLAWSRSLIVVLFEGILERDAPPRAAIGRGAGRAGTPASRARRADRFLTQRSLPKERLR